MKLKSFLPTTGKGEVAAGLTPPCSARSIGFLPSSRAAGRRSVSSSFPHGTDVTESEKEIRITAELPGLEEKDVKVELVDNVLTISGEKKAEKEEKNDNRYVVERSYGSFSRSVELPDGIKPEDIKASMAKGVLTVTLPKPAQAASKRIEVKAAA